MEKYYPAGDKLDILNAAAYVEGQIVVDVLKRCGDLLTRERRHEEAAGFISSAQQCCTGHHGRYQPR